MPDLPKLRLFEVRVTEGVVRTYCKDGHSFTKTGGFLVQETGKGLPMQARHLILHHFFGKLGSPLLPPGPAPIEGAHDMRCGQLRRVFAVAIPVRQGHMGDC